MLWLSHAVWNRRLVFIAGAAAVGLTAVLFAQAAALANREIEHLVKFNPLAPLVLAPAGFALVRWLTGCFFPGAQGSGIPQTIAALSLDERQRGRLLSIKVALGKMLLTVAGLLCGASIGREGPTVQVGASIMHGLERLGLFPSPGMRRGLILAGGAAGVAAAFNAPLAGVVFAIEEMSRSFEQRTSVIVIVGVIVAGIVAMVSLGNYAYFGQTTTAIDLQADWAFILACGLGGGLCGGVFSRILIHLSGGAGGSVFAGFRGRHPYAFAALCGLLVAVLGVASRNSIYGTGYAETRAMLAGDSTLPLSFGLLKLAATILSYASGIPGGVFSPSLAVGAGLGYDLCRLAPGGISSALILLGMAGYFSGVVQAPITAFVIVTEMTRDSDIGLSLMTCCLVAYAVSRAVCPKPLYKALAAQFRSQQNR